jgi:hypothetical protein
LEVDERSAPKSEKSGGLEGRQRHTSAIGRAAVAV